MNPIDKYSLQKHVGEYENWPRESKLYYCDQYTGSKVPGYSIEKQFQFPDYCLLLINYDCPFEEGYELIALDSEHRVIGNHSFVPPWFNSYRLDNVEELSVNLFKLTFNEDTFFEVKVSYPKPFFLGKVLKVSRCPK